MKALFLGTGNAFADGGRRPMAILLRGEGGGILLDCGPSTLPALKQCGSSPSDVDSILLSHHHGDHFAGVPFVVLHEMFRGRTKPLSVLGPPGTRSKLVALTELLYPGLDETLFPLDYRDVVPGSTHRSAGATVEPFEVDHFSGGVALGFRVVVDGKSVVFSGDTAWTDALLSPTDGADLFICECSSFDEPVERHMSYRDLSTRRDQLRAKRTFLVHASDDVIARRDELAFPLAFDGMEVDL